MSDKPENVKDDSSDSPPIQAFASDAVVAVTGVSAQSEVGVAEPAAVPAEQVEHPAAFHRLKAHCDTHGIKAIIESDPIEILALEFKNGRSTRTVFIDSEEDATNLMDYPFQDFVFLGNYSAICSYREGWIEAAVRPHGTGVRSVLGLRKIFGGSSLQNSDPREIELAGSSGATIRLTEKKGILSCLDFKSPFYLRIEGLRIAEHDKTVGLLEELSNSLFMQIDFRFDAPLTLGRDRVIHRGIAKSPGRLAEDNQLVFPRHSYESSPSSLYWYARSATSMPLLQFLAFYQCIEFFFPQYSRRETIARIKNVLKDPTFDGTKDAYINVILNATLEGRRGSLPEERKQLGATLKHCVDATALRDFLNETEERKKFYSNDFKRISDKRVSLAEEEAAVEQTAERIYDLRCKVVHTKNLDGGGVEEMILPFSKEADLLANDVELVKFLATKVLIASSAPLKL